MKMTVECTHYHESRRWVDTSYTDDDGYDHHSGHWEDRGHSLWVDIDLHRLKCSRCGQMEYYSKRARDYFEHGIGEHPSK